MLAGRLVRDKGSIAFRRTEGVSFTGNIHQPASERTAKEECGKPIKMTGWLVDGRDGDVVER